MLKGLAPLFLMGTAQECVWISLYALGPLRQNTAPFLLLIFVAFAVCLWSFFRIPLSDRKSVLSLLGFALLFRLTVLPSAPYESEDVYRYLWDARVASAGIDPFRYPPQAPELERLRDAKLYPMLNSKPYITAYPPVSQILFRTCTMVFGDRVVPMKAVFGLLEFLSLLIALRLLQSLGWSLQPLYLMAWNPFFIFEFSHSGHSDSGMIFFVFLSVYLLLKTRRFSAFISYAMAVLSKLHPILWFPLFLRRTGWKAALAGASAGAALTLIYFTPATLAKYLSSLRLYFRLFEFNAGIHYLLRYLGRAVYSQSWDQLTGPYLAACLFAIALLIWWKFPLRDAVDVMHAGFWIMTADLCLATTVHPWYLSWAALALPIFPYAFMLYWTAACFLSYIAYQYRPVYEPTWVLLVEYLPMYALMAWEIYRKRPLLRK
jgi:alpha-1,6-mannosyltransferase